jgi:rhamnosyltransferase
VIRLGKRQLALHASWRHYLWIRNHLLMWRNPAVGRLWLLSDMTQLIGKFCVLLLLAPKRISRMQHILRGLWHGLQGQGGKPAQKIS